MEDKQTVENGGTYATGVTQPGKSRNVLTVILILAIVLVGAATLMGPERLERFYQLSADGLDDVAPVPFEVPIVAGADLYPHARLEVGTQIPELGISYSNISSVNNRYYDIPEGLLVTSVTEQTKAAGVRTGDILHKVEGQPVSTTQELQAVLEPCENGEQVTLTLYRPSLKKEMEVTLPIQK